MKIAAALTLAVLPVQAAAATEDVIRFVTCPIYRDADAGRKSGCWLADEPVSGVRYDVSLSPSKPDWNRAVLIEGKVSATQDNACGGVVMDAVRTSILEEPCIRHMLPAEGFPGRKFVLQGRFIQPLSVPRKAPPPPYGPRMFPIYFDFDQAFLIYQYDDFLLDRAETWLRAAKPKHITVTGYAATDPIQVSGRTLSERPEVARERAEMIAESIRRLIPEAKVTARWKTGSRPTDDADADGLPGQSQRRAEISAEF